MKKSILMVCVLMLMLLCGCGKQQEEQTLPEPSETSSTATEAPVTATAPAPSSNETVVTDDEAPKVYWLMDTAYHLENCEELSGLTPQEVPWAVVKEIGLRQCPRCNPPRYEGYVTGE